MLNTDFRAEALADALSRTRSGRWSVTPSSRERARGAGVGVVDAAGVDVRQGDSRPTVARAGRIVSADLRHDRVTEGCAASSRRSVWRWASAHRSWIARGCGSVRESAMPVPMFHGLGFGILTLALGLGGTVLTGRRFDAEATLVQASEHRADAMAAVPVMLARIVDLSDDVRARNPLPSLRVVISSGARLDPSLARAVLGGLRRHHLQRLRLIGSRDRCSRNAGGPSGSTGDGGQARCRLRGPRFSAKTANPLGRR